MTKCATTMNDFEKAYANSYNHDAKALIAYTADGSLFADEDCTIPVSYEILIDLFLAGVVVKGLSGSNRYTRPLRAYCYGSSEAALELPGSVYLSVYDPETETWVSTS